MGNFLVSSICRAHSRSEAVYAIVKAQVGTLASRQRRGSPLQRRCAAQQAALLRALSTKMALTAAVMSCWATAATVRAKAALIASLVFIAKKFVASAKPPLALASQDYDDVFNEFNAVFETTPTPTKTLRELQRDAKVEAKRIKEESDTQQEEAEEKQRERNPAEDNPEDCTTDNTDQMSDLDDGYELLPKLEEDRAFYAEEEDNQQGEDICETEGERLMKLASSISDTSMHVEEFILNGRHDNFEVITKDVEEHAASASESEKRSIVRVLLAYCAYSEDSNYSSEMVLTAEECLQVWQGDEDRAFKSLAVLCNDVPRLCAALE
ncbi:hypothetical protein DVH05_005723 [Phytophthora capsici]|nr:hypothetical protein DVH05_005723 [Phytophthora capsici]